MGRKLTRGSPLLSVFWFWSWSLSRLWASSNCSEAPERSASWRRDSSSSSETRRCSLRSALSASSVSERARSSCGRNRERQPDAPAAGRQGAPARRGSQASPGVRPAQPRGRLPLPGRGTRGRPRQMPLASPVEQGPDERPDVKVSRHPPSSPAPSGHLEKPRPSLTWPAYLLTKAVTRP